MIFYIVKRLLYCENSLVLWGCYVTQRNYLSASFREMMSFSVAFLTEYSIFFCSRRVIHKVSYSEMGLMSDAIFGVYFQRSRYLDLKTNIIHNKSICQKLRRVLNGDNWQTFDLGCVAARYVTCKIQVITVRILESMRLVDVLCVEGSYQTVSTKRLVLVSLGFFLCCF